MYDIVNDQGIIKSGLNISASVAEDLAKAIGEEYGDDSVRAEKQ